MKFIEVSDVFLNDFGVKVVFGSVEGLGILDSPSDLIINAISTEYSLLCYTSEFGDVIFNDEMTVDGDDYKVRSYQRLDDGKFCRILLTKI